VTQKEGFSLMARDFDECLAGWIPLRKVDDPHFIELDDGKIYRKALYLMVKTMVSCRFSQENQSNEDWDVIPIFKKRILCR
jgi:hypothetical protein